MPRRKFKIQNAKNRVQLYFNAEVHVAHWYTISHAPYGMLSCRKTGHSYRHKKNVFIVLTPCFLIFLCRALFLCVYLSTSWSSVAFYLVPIVWPDLVKFRHFDKLLGLAKFWSYFGKNFMLRAIFHFVNGPILKNNLAIWSHFVVICI